MQPSEKDIELYKELQKIISNIREHSDQIMTIAMYMNGEYSVLKKDKATGKDLHGIKSTGIEFLDTNTKNGGAMVIEDRDIATVEALHDLLLDAHGYAKDFVTLKRSRELTNKMYEAMRSGQKQERIIVTIDKGTAPIGLISSILANLSLLYRKDGGPGFKWTVKEEKTKKNND